MYVLLLSQGDHEVELGLFETLEEGRDFARKLPGYSCEAEENAPENLYESVTWSELPDYTEIEYKGNIVPLSKFSFIQEGNIDIFWKELPVLTKPGTGMVAGLTRVDAYYVENAEAKEYIAAREAKYERIKNDFLQQGHEIDRNFFGSQDGEAIVYRKRGEADWHLLCHMDPEFVKGESREER